MNYTSLLRQQTDTPVRIGLVGLGAFGTSLLQQCRRVSAVQVVAVADRDPEHSAQVLRQLGYSEAEFARCETVTSAQRAIERQRVAIVPDAEVMVRTNLGLVVEATGEPEAAAWTANLALQHGKSVAMVTKEADSVAGPVLYHKACRAGLVYTHVDGDQPALLMSLVSWARAIGLRVVSAGKSSEFDFVYDPQSGELHCAGRTLALPEFQRLWELDARVDATAVRRRGDALALLPQRTVPDFCELGIVANATGLKPDRADFHAPIVRPYELPSVFAPITAGGLFAAPGALDVFNCLRRADELSFAGGVFIVVEADDSPTWRTLAGKGIPMSRDGNYALIYNPTHLLGIEAVLSVQKAGLLHHSSVDERFRPVCDLAARARRCLPAGHVLSLGGRHEFDGMDPLLVDAAPVSEHSALPYYLAANCTLRQDLPAGTVLTRGMVEPPESSALWNLRAEQDAMAWS